MPDVFDEVAKEGGDVFDQAAAEMDDFSTPKGDVFDQAAQESVDRPVTELPWWQLPMILADKAGTGLVNYLQRTHAERLRGGPYPNPKAYRTAVISPEGIEMKPTEQVKPWASEGQSLVEFPHTYLHPESTGVEKVIEGGLTPGNVLLAPAAGIAGPIGQGTQLLFGLQGAGGLYESGRALLQPGATPEQRRDALESLPLNVMMLRAGWEGLHGAKPKVAPTAPLASGELSEFGGESELPPAEPVAPTTTTAPKGPDVFDQVAAENTVQTSGPTATATAPSESVILKAARSEAVARREPVPVSWGVDPVTLPEGYTLEGDQFVYHEPPKAESPAARLAREREETMVALRERKAETEVEASPTEEEIPPWEELSDLPPTQTATENAEPGTPIEMVGERPPDILDWIQDAYPRGVRLPEEFGDYIGRARGASKPMLSLERGTPADQVLKAMHEGGEYPRLETPEQLADAMVRAAEGRMGDRARARQAKAALAQMERGLVAGSKAEAWADRVLRGDAMHAGTDVLTAYLVKGAAVVERLAIRSYRAFHDEFTKLYPEAKDFARQVWEAVQEARDKRGATAEERADVEARLASMTQDRTAADQAYDALPAAQRGKVLGTDIAMELAPEHRTREGRLQFGRTGERQARDYIHERALREVSKPGQDRVVQVLSGGIAAGKSTLAEGGTPAHLVLDTTGRNVDWLEQVIRTARDNGWRVRVDYVHRPLANALEGSLRRFNESGRVNRLAEVGPSHRAAQESVMELRRRLADAPDVQWNVHGNPGTAESRQPLVKMTWNDVAPGERAWHSTTEHESDLSAQTLQRAEASDEYDPEVLAQAAENGAGAVGPQGPGQIGGNRPLHGNPRAQAELGERATGQKIQGSSEVSQPVKDAITQYLYSRRSNATDEEIANGIVAQFGVDRAQELVLNPPAEMPGSVQSKLLGTVTRALADQERLARGKGDAAQARALAERQGRLWDNMLPRITDLAQSLQALRDIIDMSPDGHVARVKAELERKAQKALDEKAPEVQQIRTAIEEGQKEGAERIRQDAKVNDAARQAVDQTVANSEETHKAVIMELAEGWSESPAIVAHAREAVRAKANELLNTAPRPVAFTPSQHLRAILDDLGKRAAGIAANYFQGIAKHAEGLTGLYKERLGLDQAHAERLAKRMDTEFERQVKEAQAKLPKRIAAQRVARVRNAGKLDLNAPTTAVDRAIRQQLRTLNLKLGNVLKQEAERQENIHQHVAERVVEASGLTGEKADTLRNVLQQRWDALVTDAQRRKLEQLQRATDVTVTPRLKTAFEKAAELNNLGALTSERFFDVVKRSLKLKELTEADAKRLRELVIKAQEQPEGFLRERSAADVAQFTEKLSGNERWWDVPMAIFYSNVLSGMTTPAKIVFENTNLLIGNTLAEFMGRPLQNLAHPVSFVKELGSAYGRGLKKGAPQAESTLRTGVVTGVWEHGRTNIMEGQPFGRRLEPLNFWKYFTRIIGTAHETTFKPAWEVKQTMIARDLAIKEGLTGRALTQRVADLMANTKDAVAATRTQAMQELMSLGRLSERQPGESLAAFTKRQAADRLDLQRRTTEIIEQRRETNMPGSTEVARDFALRTAYLNEPYGYLGSVATGVRSFMEKGRRDFPLAGTLAKTQIPFTTIVANILNEKLNWTPVGLIRAARSHWTGELYGRQMLSASERSQLYAKAIVGTVAVGALADLFAQHIHGNGPSSPAKRKQLQAAGWIPHAIEINGEYHSYMHLPIALPLAVVGNYLDWHRYGKGQDADGVSRLAFTMKATANAIVSQGMLDSVRRLFEALGSESTSEGADKLQKLAARTATAFVVPNLVQQVDRLYDPTIYDQSGMHALLTSQVPFVRRENKPALNVLGESVKSGPFHTWASSQSQDPIWRMIVDKQAFVPEPTKNAIIGSKAAGKEYYRAITPDEHYDLIADSGPKIKAELQRNLNVLKALPPEQAQAVVKAIADKYHEAAKAKLK